MIERQPDLSLASFGFAMGHVRLRRYREARDLFERGMRTYAGQPGFAHALARLLAAAPDANVRDGRRALALLDALMKDQQSLALAETMAMALAEVGRFEEAAGWQRTAIAAAEESGRTDTRATLARNLALYQRREPCRTPWPDDDPVHRPRAQR